MPWVDSVHNLVFCNVCGSQWAARLFPSFSSASLRKLSTLWGECGSECGWSSLWWSSWLLRAASWCASSPASHRKSSPSLSPSSSSMRHLPSWGGYNIHFIFNKHPCGDIMIFLTLTWLLCRYSRIILWFWTTTMWIHLQKTLGTREWKRRSFMTTQLETQQLLSTQLNHLIPTQPCCPCASCWDAFLLPTSCGSSRTALFFLERQVVREGGNCLSGHFKWTNYFFQYLFN